MSIVNRMKEQGTWNTTHKFLKQEKSTVAQATAVNRVAADTNSNSDEREQECEHRGWKNMVDSGMLQRQKQS